MKKIFWAFDALEEGLKTNLFVGETLASLGEKLPVEIHPVFALGAEVMDSVPGFLLDSLETMKKVAVERIQSVLSKVTIPGLVSPEVIVKNSFSKSQVVHHLLDFAEKNNADLIAIGSHGRHGLSRGVLGSFAETLLLQSRLPVLVVGQNFDQIPKWDNLLFPTDFSDGSSYAFDEALKLAKTLGAKITLFHHLSPMIDPIIQSAIAPFGGVWVPYQKEMQNLMDAKQKMLEEWAVKGRERGVAIDTFLDAEATDTTQAILHYAREHRMGLIAMGAQSGTLATALFGAVTRKVVRSAPCPVWLLRKRNDR